MSDSLAERNEWMVSAYMAGMTLQGIGDQYGITRERVRQIISKRFPVKQISKNRIRLAQEHHLAHQIRRSQTEERQCFVCWARVHIPVTSKRRLSARLNFCGVSCVDLYRRTRHRLDPELFLNYQARAKLRCGKKPGQRAWAKRRLAGIKAARPPYNKPIPTSLASILLAEVYRLRALATEKPA